MNNDNAPGRLTLWTILKYLILILLGFFLVTVSILTDNQHLDIILSYVVLAYIIWFCLFHYPIGIYASFSYFLYELIGRTVKHGILPPPDYTRAVVYLAFAIIASVIAFTFLKRTTRLRKDISAIALREKMIRDSQDNYLRLINHLDEIIWLLDLKLNVLQVNETAAAYLGFSEAELSGKPLADFFVYEDSQKLQKQLQETIKTKQTIKIPLLKKGGGHIPTETRLQKSIWNEREIYFAVSRDISRQEEEQEKRYQSEAKFVKVFDSSPAMMFIIDPVGDRFLEVNRSFLNLLGYKKEEIIGKTCQEIELFADPQVREDFRRVVDEQGKWKDTKVTIKKLNGTVLPVSFNAEVVDFLNEPCILVVMVDISTLVTLNDKLTLQTMILFGVSVAENILLTESDYELAIRKALPVVGNSLEVDQVVIFNYEAQTQETASLFSVKWIWTQDEQTGLCEVSNLFNQQQHEFVRQWIELLKSGQSLSTNHKYPSPQDKQVLLSLGIKSALMIPLFLESAFWGVLAFVDCAHEKEWNRSDEITLLPLGSAIGGVLSRQLTLVELREAKTAADNANQAKSSFLATMSHEIRTPLNGVIGMSNLLQQTQLSSEQTDYVNAIRSNSNALLELISDILDFSKIESEKIDLEMEPYNLIGCIEDVLDLMAVRASEKRLDLFYQLDSEIRYEILGDSLRLRQILLNLIGNAIKFTPSGYIEIKAELAEVSEPDVVLRFSIKDTGIGIGQPEQKKLFNPFFQADSSTSRKYGGTGLGLAICARLVRLMGGEISVQSELGAGTTFIFTFKTSFVQTKPVSLPEHLTRDIPTDQTLFICITNDTLRDYIVNFLSKTPVKSVVIDDPVAFANQPGKWQIFGTGISDIIDISEDINEYISKIRLHEPYKQLPMIFLRTIGLKNLDNDQYYNTLNYFITKPVKLSTLAETLLQAFGKIKQGCRPGDVPRLHKNFALQHPHQILVVDDNQINQKLMLNILQRLGYQAETAGTGIEALNQIRQGDFDFVFMDVAMPEMDGFEATRNIRHSKTVKIQPIIVAMTAHAMQGDKEKCIEAGMDNYISKPVRFEDVLSVLSQQRGKE